MNFNEAMNLVYSVGVRAVARPNQSFVVWYDSTMMLGICPRGLCVQSANDVVVYAPSLEDINATDWQEVMLPVVRKRKLQ